MEITFIAQNLKFGGFQDDSGNYEDRWPLLAERLKSTPSPADFILLNEARDWSRQGHGPLGRAMDDLDMDATPLAPASSGQHTALLYRKERVGRWKHWNTGYVDQVTHSFGIGAFDVGLPYLLSVVPAHLTPYGGDKGLQEANLIASRAYRHGPYAVIGGDINYSPAEGPDPNFAAMRPYNIASRSLVSGKGSEIEVDRRVAQKFQQAGYVDVAFHMYEQTMDETYLTHTSIHDRIDQFWVTKPLAAAIIDYCLLVSPEGASDHDGIMFTLDTDKIDTVRVAAYD